MPRADGPFRILERINDNAYKLDLPIEFGASPTFIVLDLKPYMGNEDEDITSTDTTTPPTAIVPSIPPPEAKPVIHKFYTRRDRNVLLIRNLGVEDKDI